MDTDRNLLFGVLALQAGLIDTEQFVEACTLWASRKDSTLAELLIERGWIVTADRDHLDYLLRRKLQKGGVNALASLAAVPDEVKRSLAAIGDESIQQSLAGLPPPAACSQETMADPAGSKPDRHTLIRLHATGGIGRVWLARDHALGRDVALKELRPEQAHHPALASRFLQEARITGQLEHPGIVPVYELVRPGTGQPFYTMRFVKGHTLSEAAQAHRRRQSAGQGESLELLTLLNAFVTVCNTVAYAHSRGVLHRDLKGQNVILGDFGEVIVLDWGLAKQLQQQEDAPPLPVVGLPPVGEADLTIQGQALGTPAYMAPEQAAGQLDRIGPRTDVYGLAAILYEILTGGPPFAGADAQEVIRRVLHEEPARPSRLCPGVPAPLEAACLRGLAKDRADRFESAAALAQVVQRWLAELAERTKAAQERERFFNLSFDLLAVVGFDGSLRQVNAAWEETLGWSREEILSSALADRVHPDDLARSVTAIRGIEAGDPLKVFENRMRCKDGTYHWLLWNATRIEGEQLYYTVGRDITERKRVEAPQHPSTTGQ